MAPPKAQKAATNGPHRTKTTENTRQLKRKRVVEDIEALNSRIRELKDGPVEKFSDLPLSAATTQGLENNHYKTTTDVQARAIVLGLKGRDILGAAKTGSGKTLAFLVPVLENLYRQKWNDTDGLGALILAPTRELAIQIFGILKKIGRKHAFSAGLVTGGKSFQEEKEVLARMNIVIGTPGRVLHHLDQTASLNLDNLQMLVLDEADRIMDMGFKKDVDAIVEHLPPTRQTMLFSATQTKKLDDLRRLSVQDPEYISVHEQAQTATPATLKQYYIACPLPEKLNTLWGFIRENTKSKTIVFLSSAKQVRFVYETFRHMQPGLSLLHLHGRQKQTARLDITKRFSSMQHACLFATDVAARGLDIPAVDWVLQLDCPEDVDTYIHRVGRTARYERDGQAVLFLEPTEEEGMLKRLEQKKIPIKLIKVKEKKQENVKHKLQDMCFKDPEIKYLGQKAFISYARSVYIHPDKEVFQIDKLDLQGFATSLGLPGAPKIKFQKGIDMKAIKNRSRAEALLSDDEEEGAGGKSEAIRTKYDRMFERQNQDVLAPHRQRLVQKDGRFGTDPTADDDNTADDFLTVKRRLDDIELSGEDDAAEGENSHTNSDKKIRVKDGPDLPVDSKRREKLLTSKKALLKYGGKGHKTIFDDDGTAHEAYELEDEQAFRKRGEASEQRHQFVEKEAARVKAEDIADKELVKQKRRDKREKRKARELAAEQDDDEDGDLGSHLPVVPMEYLGDESDDEKAAEEVKKPKKWFQTDDSDEEDDTRPRKKKRKTKGELEAALEGAETLEDLEALAQSL